MALLMGETPKWAPTVAETTPMCWAVVLGSGLLGTLLGYVGFKVAKAVTAVGFLCLQSISKVIVICLGMVLFGDTLTVLSAIGAGLLLAGSAWCSSLSMPSHGPPAVKEVKKSDCIEQGISTPEIKTKLETIEKPPEVAIKK